jgi:hypothetical protein
LALAYWRILSTTERSIIMGLSVVIGAISPECIL